MATAVAATTIKMRRPIVKQKSLKPPKNGVRPKKKYMTRIGYMTRIALANNTRPKKVTILWFEQKERSYLLEQVRKSLLGLGSNFFLFFLRW